MGTELMNLSDICPAQFAGTIVLSAKQIAENPFITKDGKAGFYNLIRRIFESHTHKVDEIDCCHINIAKNIQDSWFAYSKANGVDGTALAMQLCICGPKALEELPDNTVETQEGCLTFKQKEPDES